MARSTWSGFLSFGLVSVPVGMYTATSDQTVHFNQLHDGTSNRVRYKKVDEVTGEELSADEIVNGYQTAPGEYVVVTSDELKQAAAGKSEMIEITDFVDMDEIDPKYFRQTYYLAPRGKGADRAYALLRQALRETRKVGIATFVSRGKEHLAAVRSDDDVLMIETMYFADEIRDAREELDDIPDADFSDTRELAIAKQLVDSLTAPWAPAKYKDSYRERIEELIDEKRAGRAVVFETEHPKSNVIDLMAALQASVQQTSAARENHDTAESAMTKKSATKKRVPAGEQQSFDGMSKAELLERAAELDVPGRTKMTKLELVQALSDASTPAEETTKTRRRQVS